MAVVLLKVQSHMPMRKKELNKILYHLLNSLLKLDWIGDYLLRVVKITVAATPSLFYHHFCFYPCFPLFSLFVFSLFLTIVFVTQTI